MRRTWTVVVSLATHAVVIGVLAASAPAHVRPTVATAPLTDVPIEVVMLDEPRSSPSPSPSPSPISTAAASTASQSIHAHEGSVTGASTSTGHEVGPHDRAPGPGPSPGKPGKSMLHMRYGPEYVSSIQSMLDRAADMPPGTPPEKLAPSGLLHDDGGGTMRGDEGEFGAKVGRDGSVAFEDGANVRLGGRRGPPVQPDGPPPVLSFDITDAMMRRHGIDPYASAKLRFLDRTRPERVEIGLAFRKDQLAHTAPMMQANIARAFVMFSDPVKQRRALFELWDDCAETGTDDLVEAGRVGRALVLGTIRTKFPAGTARAYTADEIATFGKGRTSKAVFAPYAE